MPLEAEEDSPSLESEALLTPNLGRRKDKKWVIHKPSIVVLMIFVDVDPFRLETWMT